VSAAPSVSRRVTPGVCVPGAEAGVGWEALEAGDGAGAEGVAPAVGDPPRPPVRAIVRADPRRVGAPAAGSTIVGPAVAAADPRPAAPVGTPPAAGAAGRFTLGVEEEPPAAGHAVNATRPVANISDTSAAPISDAALPAPASSPRL